MRALFMPMIVAALFAGAVLPAHAQTQAAVNAAIAAQLPTNGRNQITANNVRAAVTAVSNALFQGASPLNAGSTICNGCTAGHLLGSSGGTLVDSGIATNNIPLLNGTNTFTGGVNFNIAGTGLGPGITQTQDVFNVTPGGSGPIGYNILTVNEGADCTAPGVCAGWLFNFNTVGPNSNGSKSGIFINNGIQADGGSMLSSHRDYSGLQIQSTSAAVMPAGLNGPAIWGGANCVANLTSTARGWANMGCLEGDLNNESPDLVDLVGTTMALTGHVHPTGTVAAYSVGSCVGCDQFDVGYLVSNRNGNNGVSTTGAVIGAINAATMGEFANFPLSAFTTYFNFNNLVINGSGQTTKSGGMFGSSLAFGGGGANTTTNAPQCAGNFNVAVAANGSLGLSVLNGSFILLRDDDDGGTAFAVTEPGFGSTLTVPPSVTNFVTSDPGAAASKWWIQNSSGHYGDPLNRYSTTKHISYWVCDTTAGTFP